MSLKDIQYLIKKTDIIALPILPLNEYKISETIDILCYLIGRQGLKDVVKNKVIFIKDDYLTIKNVIYTLYQKQKKPN